MSEARTLAERNPLIVLINTARLLLILAIVILVQFQPERFLIGLEKIAIGASAYAILLLALPFSRIRSPLLGYCISFIDSLFVLLVLTYSGDLDSPFFLLLFFPLISLAILYEIQGAIIAIVIFTAYAIFFLGLQVYSVDTIMNLIIRMCLLSVLALYLGNIAKSIKGKERIRELETELQRLKAGGR